MSSITFSGLASGLDTDSIVTSLMEVERQPLELLETDIEYFELETEAYAEFDTLLANLRDSASSMDSLDSLANYSATSGDSSLLMATASNSAMAGTYHVEVLSLAESQKDVSAEGFADSDSELLSGTLTIGENSIDYTDVTLEELSEMINEADTGLRAAIINDGTESGYRLTLRGEEAGQAIEVLGTGSIAIDTLSNGHTYSASQAHVIVDNVDIYSNSNTLDSAIPGLSIELFDAEIGSEVTLTVATDTSKLSSSISSFVSSFNAIVQWIDDEEGNSWANDSGIVGAKRKLQNFLTTNVSGSESFSNLVELGFSTDYTTGLISVDSETLDAALATDMDGVLALFAGDDETDGIADLMYAYLDSETDSDDGISARRKDSNDANIDRLNSRIELMEIRLETREEYLRAQFTAMETLMSEMETQSSYLSEISALSSSSD
ncbi:flagellar hook-associated protein 2 [Desulfuromusa kysingii]|uniref:Flagellar hook-associated protein 2 n=1 Tax=Desulfuromusa kysingii TaxID=37625 RepID=A0A1H3VYM5_9BACT|nr:flagellar filament capping protein FliD [Desulfuromusa kysingii]SDZ79917.1 flagellar hook-associated protein 2 [Desulfuromusa kysingii]